MSQPLCYFHNWVREIFENRFFRGSWCSGVVEQESFGTQPCAIQTEICASNHGSIPQKDAATYANGGEPAHYGQNCKSLFEFWTAVYQKIPALLRHWTSSLWKPDFQIFPLLSCENNIVVETCEIRVFFFINRVLWN